MLEQAEVALAADEARDRDHSARGLAQAFQPRHDDLAHTRGHRRARVTPGRGVPQGANGLEDEQRIAGADSPHLLVEPRQGVRIALGPGERPRQRRRFRTRERRQRHAREPGMVAELLQRHVEQGGAGEVFVPRREDQEDRTGVDPPAEVRREAHRQLVGPVHVLEHDDERLPRGESLEEAFDGLEDARRLRRRRPARATALDLGKHARELAAPDRLHPRQGPGIRHETGAQCIHPRSERQNLSGLVRAADDRPGIALARQRRDLADEPRLAHSGLADDRHHVASAPARVIEQLTDGRELRLAPCERRIDAQAVALRQRAADPGAARRALRDRRRRA